MDLFRTAEVSFPAAGVSIFRHSVPIGQERPRTQAGILPVTPWIPGFFRGLIFPIRAQFRHIDILLLMGPRGSGGPKGPIYFLLFSVSSCLRGAKVFVFGCAFVALCSGGLAYPQIPAVGSYGFSCSEEGFFVFSFAGALLSFFLCFPDSFLSFCAAASVFAVESD